MKKNEVISIYRFLGGVKLNKISDKDTRNAVIVLHLAMHKIVKGLDDDTEVLRKKFLEGHEEEVAGLTAERQAYQNEPDEDKKTEILRGISEKYGEILKVEQQLNDVYVEMLKADVELPSVKLSAEAFVEALAEQDVDITPTDLLHFTELFSE